MVCPHRMQRPWSGQEETPQKNDLPEFDPSNPLCPGVVRSNGEVHFILKIIVSYSGHTIQRWKYYFWQKNPIYQSTFVFTNDFPALLENVPAPPSSEDPLFQAREARGTCRVMCFHPKSNKTLPVMSPKEIRTVIDEYGVFDENNFHFIIFPMPSSPDGFINSKI